MGASPRALVIATGMPAGKSRSRRVADVDVTRSALRCMAPRAVFPDVLTGLNGRAAGPGVARGAPWRHDVGMKLRGRVLSALVAPAPLAVCAALGCAGLVSACAGSSPRDAVGFNIAMPQTVLVDRLQFGVTPLPGGRGFLLELRFTTSQAGEAPQRAASEADYRQAAQKALPSGCTLARMEKGPDGAYRVDFTCAVSTGDQGGPKPASGAKPKASGPARQKVGS